MPSSLPRASGAQPTTDLVRQTALITDVALALARQASIPEMLQTCAESMVRHLEVAFARIWTLNEHAQVLEMQASAGMYTHLDGPHGRVPMGTLKIGRIAATREPHLTNEVASDPDIGDHDWAEREGMVAFAGFPLVVEEQVVGVMGMFARHPLAPETLDHLAGISLVIANGIERKRVEVALQEERESIEIINQLGQLVTGELNLDALVRSVTDAATHLTGAAFGAFFYNVFNEQGESYTLYALSGIARERFANFPMPRNTSIFGPTFRGEGVVRLDDVGRDPRYGRNPPYHGLPKGHPPVASYLAVPVISRSGEVLGGLFFGHPGTGMFTERAERITVGLASHAAVAIDNARLYREAREATRLRDDFLLGVSHDLKTPLTVIRGQAQLLQRRLSRYAVDVSEVQEGLRSIEERSRAMAGLLDELLDVARLRLGERLDLTSRPMNLGTLLQTLVASLNQTTRHTLLLEIEDGDLIGSWDERRLARVVDNLLSNAVKYSAAGSTVTVRLSRESDETGTWAILQIRDEGVGIPTKDLPHVFEQFYRASNAPANVSGTGLGLSGVQRLIQQHGGSIALESVEAVGTTVSVRLPLLPQMC